MGWPGATLSKDKEEYGNNWLSNIALNKSIVVPVISCML